MTLPPETPPVGREELVLIHTDKGFWRPDSAGYTFDPHEAGQWERYRAEEIINDLGAEKEACLIAAPSRPTPVPEVGEIVERLRGWAYVSSEPHPLWEQAADALQALSAKLAAVEGERGEAIREMGNYAREAGFAKGKLEASELPGMIDDWREERDTAVAHAQREKADAEKFHAMWEAAEARVSVLEGALREIGGMIGVRGDTLEDAKAIARAVLTEPNPDRGHVGEVG